MPRLTFETGSTTLRLRRHSRQEAQKLLRDAGGELLGANLAVKMCRAAAEGDLSTVRSLVENGVNPNLSDYDGRTMMHLAASCGNIDILNYLLSLMNIVFVNPVDITGGTPLDDARRHEQRIAITVLLEHNALCGDDPQLTGMLRNQENLREKQNRLSRVPQVESLVSQSVERKHDSDLREFMHILFGREASNLTEGEGGTDLIEFRDDFSDESEEKHQGLTHCLEALSVELKKFVEVMMATSEILRAVQSGAKPASDNSAPPVRWNRQQTLQALDRQESFRLSKSPAMAKLVNAIDDLNAMLARVYRQVPDSESVHSAHRVLFSRYGKVRKDFHQKILLLVALSKHLAQTAKRLVSGHASKFSEISSVLSALVPGYKDTDAMNMSALTASVTGKT